MNFDLKPIGEKKIIKNGQKIIVKIYPCATDLYPQTDLGREARVIESMQMTITGRGRGRKI